MDRSREANESRSRIPVCYASLVVVPQKEKPASENMDMSSLEFQGKETEAVAVSLNGGP